MITVKEIEATINQERISKLIFTNDNNYSVSFFNFGGYIDSIHIPYRNDPSQSEDVLLGYKDFRGYMNDQSYINCIVGRICGRISNANFNLNAKQYKLFANNGSHHLHGGKEGFNKKIWKIVNLDETANCLKCVLQYISPHLEEGYPGRLECNVTYSLTNNNELIIDFVAESDQDTIVSLTNHNYWNFHGHHSNYQNAADHTVKIDAQFFCESDQDLIPTGQLQNVGKTKLNFQKYKAIDKNILDNNGIDECYCIDEFDRKIREVACVYSNLTKMGLHLYSNQPGLQFYTGNMMDDYYLGKYARKYGHQYGLCLEPQLFPDAINHKNFISPILRKGEKYNSSIVMKLKNDF